MDEKQPGNDGEKYYVKAYSPNDLSAEELAKCIAIIERGDAVNPNSAEAELPRAEVLAIARWGDGIVAVGAIKRVRRGYASTIAKRSESSFGNNSSELGYIAVDSEHRGRGLSHRIVAELLSKHEGQLFATTFNNSMKSTLTKAGFIQKGRAWKGQRGQLSLWVKD